MQLTQSYRFKFEELAKDKLFHYSYFIETHTRSNFCSDDSVALDAFLYADTARHAGNPVSTRSKHHIRTSIRTPYALGAQQRRIASIAKRLAHGTTDFTIKPTHAIHAESVISFSQPLNCCRCLVGSGLITNILGL